jgi:spore coat polysaccharide biosynthesis protein SpsF
VRVAAIIQARMGSTRLPGKVLMTLAGKPMIERVVERAQRIAGVSEVIVATSTLPGDDALARFVERELRIPLVRGSSDDVLARYHAAMQMTTADAIVRITADCPLLSPTVSAKIVAAYGADVDYASNTLTRSYPRGLDTEIVSRKVLELTHREATEPQDREHVTIFVWRQPQRFRLRAVTDREDNSDLRWTVDTPEDFELARRIYDALYAKNPHFDYAETLAAVQADPVLRTINQHIEQKKLTGL